MNSEKEVKDAKMKVYWRDADSSFHVESKEVDFSEPLEEEKAKEASDLRKVSYFLPYLNSKVFNWWIYRLTAKIRIEERFLKSALTCRLWIEVKGTCQCLS